MPHSEGRIRPKDLNLALHSMPSFTSPGPLPFWSSVFPPIVQFTSESNLKMPKCCHSESWLGRKFSEDTVHRELFLFILHV